MAGETCEFRNRKFLILKSTERHCRFHERVSQGWPPPPSAQSGGNGQISGDDGYNSNTANAASWSLTLDGEEAERKSVTLDWAASPGSSPSGIHRRYPLRHAGPSSIRNGAGCPSRPWRNWSAQRPRPPMFRRGPTGAIPPICDCGIFWATRALSQPNMTESPCPPNIRDLPDWWCRISISGKARNGFAVCISAPLTTSDTGKSWAITTMATRGWSRGSADDIREPLCRAGAADPKLQAFVPRTLP